jgi:hypothetical protein
MQNFHTLASAKLEYWRNSTSAHPPTTNRLIDISIAIGTGFAVSLITHYVEKYFSERKRKRLGEHFLPISKLKRCIEKVVTVFAYIVHFSEEDPPGDGIVPLPSNEEIVRKTRHWNLGDGIPDATGMKNLLFNKEHRYTDKEPSFADGLCNEIQELILSVEEFILSSTFAFITLNEQSTFMDFMANEFTIQFKREIEGDTGMKGAYDPEYILTSDDCYFDTWVPRFFKVVTVLNKYIVDEEDLIPATR